MCEVVFRPTAQLRRHAAIDYHGENMKLLPALCFTAALLAQTWAPQTSNTRASLRGVSAVDARSVWASGSGDAFLATGGPSAARIFHSRDRGLSWTVAGTPIRHDSPSAGIFSLAFADPSHGIAVGGDYSKDTDDRQNIALTSDGGRSWSSPPNAGPKGFRSAVSYVPGRKLWIVTGTSGSDLSGDGGKTWKLFDSGAYNAMSFVPGGAGWAVGPQGRIARFLAPAH